MEADGLLTRRTGPAGKIVNALPAGVTHSAAPVIPSPAKTHVVARHLLSEDEVKTAVKVHLEADGWTVSVAWGRGHGIDIRAQRGDERLYLGAKGEAANPPQQVDYFIGALGELVQRMRDPYACYGLALPDNRQYRGLMDRLPPLARERLKFTAAGCRHGQTSTTTIGRRKGQQEPYVYVREDELLHDLATALTASGDPAVSIDQIPALLIRRGITIICDLSRIQDG